MKGCADEGRMDYILADPFYKEQLVSIKECIFFDS